MGYEGDPVEALFPTEPTERAAHALADAGTDRLELRVRENTPVDTNPYRQRQDGRPRGALRASIRRRPGLVATMFRGQPALEGTVFTDDPVAEYVEWDTSPHEIRARAGKHLRFRSRLGWTDSEGHFHPPGSWVSVETVSHPGTKGAHMFSIGALKTESELDEFAQPILDRWAREQTGAKDLERLRAAA